MPSLFAIGRRSYSKETYNGGRIERGVCSELKVMAMGWRSESIGHSVSLEADG